MKIVLSKHVVLVMQIINIIINMDNIRPEGPNEGPIFKINIRLRSMSLNKKFVTQVKESVTYKVLKRYAV